MKLLLHTCCAPCLIYPLERLREQGFAVSGLFYNPNIHPLGEYNNRKKAVEEYSRNCGLEMTFTDYLPLDFFWAVSHKDTAPERCSLCWSLRLEKTARVAKENGFEYFSTTLLVSPYQDQELLQRIGNNIATAQGLEFYYEDFRPGFRQAHNKAHAQGIYCQKYCGCIYSCPPAGRRR
jgi:predicted adenine nucleotide alpha hydrolase (AANH) superfamily ATPase